jgi:ribosome-binding factor A
LSRRTERVNDLLRDEISSIISRDLKDPRLAAMVSVTEVDVSPDFGQAVVFVSLLGNAVEETFKALQSSAPYVHHELRSRLSLRRTPQITFRRDDSLERGARLTKLINEVTHQADPG